MVESAVESHVEIVVGSDKKLIRVLHVDDEPALLRVTKQCLELEGMFQVDSVTSVEEALAKLEKEQYDAVVSDYQMPVKDGLEFLEMLRKNGNTIPFILFTGKGREEIAIKALNLGADQYLNKIGDPETVYCELEHAIRKTVEQTKAESALETCGERYARLFESAVDGILINGLDGRISSLNPAAANILGYNSPKELIGKPAVELYADPDSRARLLQELMEKGHVKECELTWKRKDGTLIEILASVTLQKDEKGNLLRTEGIIRDVSERKRSERLLRESEEKYRELAESISDVFFAFDKDLRYTYWNEASEKLTGIKAKNAIGKSLTEVFPDVRGTKVEQFYQNIVKTNQHQIFVNEYRVGDKDFVFEIDAYPAKDGLSVFVKDITGRKKAEETLRESENYLKAVFSSIFTGVIVVNAETHAIVDANPNALAILGTSREQIIGRVCHNFICPADKGKCPISDLKQTVDNSERKLITADGHLKPIIKTVVRIKLKGQEYFVESFVDIAERKKAEEALKQSEEKYRNLFENAKDVIVHFDLKGNLTAINKAAEVYGFNESGMLGKNMLKFVSKRYWPKLLKDVAQIALGKTAEGRVGIHTPKGDKIVEYRSSPIFSDNRVVGIQTILEDTTERKKAEEALRESEEKYKDLFENALDVILTLDLKGGITAVNNSILRFGYKKEDLVGKNILDFVSKACWPTVMMDFSQVTQGEPAKNETEIVVPTGKILVEYNARPIAKESNVTGVQINLRDITERKKGEELLRESEERFRGLFEGIQDPVGIFVGREGCLIDYNTAFKKLSGYTDEELNGKVFLDFVHPDDHAMVLEKYQTKYSEEELPLVYEIRGLNKKGESIPLELSVSTYKKKGRVIGIEVIHRDIAGRKRYEERLSALNTYSRDLNMAENREEIYRLTLDAMQKVLGFEYADFFMVDKSLLCIADQRGYPEPFPLELPLDGSKKGISIKAVKTGNSIVVHDVRKNMDFVEGLPGILSELAVPIKDGQKTFGVLNVESRKLNAFDEKDLELLEILASHAATAISNLEYATNLETYAREIRESQQRFERLFMDNPEAAVCLGPDFHILDINPCFEKLFEYNLAEIKGKHINEVVVPQERIEEGGMLDRKAEKGYVYFDTARKRKDGSLIPVSVSAAPISVEDKLVGYVAMYKDISELKRAEAAMKEMMQKLATMNEKLRVVGSLTRHDVRNKLSVVTGNVFLANRRLPDNPEVLDYLHDISSACQQILEIFDFARNYEMLGDEELKNVDVAETVEKAISLFSDLKGVKVSNECRELRVLADSLLTRLFYNLIDNSLKYGEKITQIRVHYEKADDGQLRLVYEDDGCGISLAEKANLFKEGYGKGTGYGLYLIRKMMEVYGWTIQETGEKGSGVKFTIAIPMTNQKGRENYQIR
jgi:PAS domain S-box-containing protein